MSSPTDRSDRPDATRRRLGLVDDTTLAVDRVACTGHGVCAQLLAQVRLDEWGYPIVDHASVPATEADVAIRLCPARALYRR
ncbi:ferredoxin [Intrasporangium flavum]|uniref:ferredoxin n=1 Tax=Intrasporangium flavum TaxID=1428657 RepID=UPI00096CC480|nr:ferredoxin [Intrasporangium flavum]